MIKITFKLTVIAIGYLILIMAALYLFAVMVERVPI